MTSLSLQSLNLSYKNKKTPTLDTKTFNLLAKEAKRKVFSGEFQVTPEIASVILDNNNPKNRKLHAQSVTALARDMASGRWLGHVGDEVTFDSHGQLNNGQHRLAAIVESGISQPMVLRFGLSDEGRLVEGRGRTKQFSDYITMSGGAYKHQNAFAAAVRLLYGFHLDQFRPYGESGKAKPTNGELNEILTEFGDSLYESLVYMKSLNMLNVMVDTNAAVLHFLFKNSVHGEDLANEFFEAIASGADMSNTDPRLIIRNRFTSPATSKLLRQQSNKDSAMGLVVKAWNAWVNSKDWSSKERTPSALPVIDGLSALGPYTLYVDPEDDATV